MSWLLLSISTLTPRLDSNMTRTTVLSAFAISVSTFALSVASASADDLAQGEQVFRKCQICHSIGPGAKNKVGPELNGLDGRHSGSVEGYGYSVANKNSGIVWKNRASSNTSGIRRRWFPAR